MGPLFQNIIYAPRTFNFLGNSYEKTAFSQDSIPKSSAYCHAEPKVVERVRGSNAGR